MLQLGNVHKNGLRVAAAVWVREAFVSWRKNLLWDVRCLNQIAKEEDTALDRWRESDDDEVEEECCIFFWVVNYIMYKMYT